MEVYFAKRTQPSSLFSVKALRNGVSLQPAAHSVMLQLSGGLSRRWYTNPRPVGVFVGYRNADPSNVSPPVRVAGMPGAEMRVAETHYAHRALG